MSGLALLVFWGFFTNYSIKPEWFGTVIAIGIQLILLLTVIYSRMITLDSMDSAYEFIDDQSVKKVWLDTKKKYSELKGNYTRGTIDTYRRSWVIRHFLYRYLDILEDKKPQKLAKNISEEILKEVNCPPGKNKKEFYQS